MMDHIVTECRLGITKQRGYGSFMSADNTIIVDIYLDMLQLFLKPQLQGDGIINIVIF